MSAQAGLKRGAWLSRLRPADLFSIPVLAGTWAELIVVQLASPYNTPGSNALRIGLQTLAVIAEFTMMYLLYQVLRRHLPYTALRTSLLFVIPSSALSAGYLLGWLFRWTGLDTPAVLPIRVFATLMHVSIMTLLLWFAVSGLRWHYERLDGLMQERDRLETLNHQIAESLSDLDAETTETVRNRIMEGFAGASGATAVLQRLTATIEEVVRPLSQQLESQSEIWIPPTGQDRAGYRIDWFKAAADGLNPRLFSPIGVLIALNLIAAPMNLGRSGLMFELQFLAISALVLVPAYYTTRWLGVKIAQSGHRVRQKVAFFATTNLAGLSMALASYPITWDTPKPLRYFILGPIFTTIIAFAWGSATAAQEQARATEEAWLAATRDLGWHVARARELHRQHRRALAHAVHGQVQAALTAGVLQLRSAINDGSLTDGLIDDVRGRIIECVEALDPRQQASTPAKILEKVTATWSGIAAIEMSVSDEAMRDLLSDAQCLTTLDDVIPELVFNSIKHGKATLIRLRLALFDERILNLTAEDNGIGPSPHARAGIGTRLLDDCSISWSRRRDGETTVTSVLLPLQPAPQPVTD